MHVSDRVPLGFESRVLARLGSVGDPVSDWVVGMWRVAGVSLVLTLGVVLMSLWVMEGGGFGDFGSGDFELAMLPVPAGVGEVW